MTITLNGDTRTVMQAELPAILAQLGIDSAASGIAVAINGTVVRRAEWAHVRVSDGDEVEVLTAVQGG